MIMKIKGAKEIVKDFSAFARVNNQALSSSMNRANLAGQTASSKAMRSEWVGLKASDLKRYIYKRKATRAKPHTQFTITSRSINLMDFVKAYNKKGLAYRLKNKQRTMRGSFTKKKMFFTRSKSETVKDKRGYDVPKLNLHFSITPTSMFLGAEGDDVYIESYFNTFNKRYIRELKRLGI